MHDRLLPLLCLPVLGGALCAQQYQIKYLHNDLKTSQGFRATTDQEDTLYFMPPPGFHSGYGSGQGWVVGLSDADASTAETIKLGYVGYTSTGGPDTGKAYGLEASFSISGQGSGADSRLWFLTLQNASPRQAAIPLPREYGLRLVLPKPIPPSGKTWKDVAVTVFYQPGDRVKLPAGVLPTQMLYTLSGSTALPIGPKGSTILLGTMFEEPSLQVYAHSSAYGGSQPEDLFGPESLVPDPRRGDQLGFLLNYKRFRFRVGPPLALLLVAPARLSNNQPTPWGDLILVPSFLLLGPIVVDAAGSVDTGPIAVPTGVRFWAQALFADPLQNDLALSGAQEVRVQ